MKPDDLAQLIADVKVGLVAQPCARFAIIGNTPTAYDVRAAFASFGCLEQLTGIYADVAEPRGKLRPIARLAEDRPDYIIIASDEGKEALLEAAAQYLGPPTKPLLAGYGHLDFSDPDFDGLERSTLAPSLANGYGNCAVHLFQCLRNSTRLGLEGAVVEFGMFKGGTTLLLSRMVERLGRSWPVIGFDTFAGFPPPASLLDMYAHRDCEFSDEALVRRSLAERNIRIVKGPVAETVPAHLEQEHIVLAFVDTDNYSSARAILATIADRVLVGGAIVFDHFTGEGRFRYTLGERIAAKSLLDDDRYFNLHGTGVFYRQR